MSFLQGKPDGRSGQPDSLTRSLTESPTLTYVERCNRLALYPAAEDVARRESDSCMTIVRLGHRDDDGRSHVFVRIGIVAAVLDLYSQLRVVPNLYDLQVHEGQHGNI